MNKSGYYFLAAMVVLAPHLWPGVAVSIGLIMLLIAAIAAWTEIAQHMRTTERARDRP